MEFEKDACPVIKVEGFIEKGKQFDLEIDLPDDRRNVVSGVIRDSFREPVEDAVVDLVEIENHERKPVSHTFTNEHGEFVFGPLCPDRNYEILIWANKVKHIKLCKECKRVGKCLKGVHLECDDVKDECDCECDCED